MTMEKLIEVLLVLAVFAVILKLMKEAWRY